MSGDDGDHVGKSTNKEEILSAIFYIAQTISLSSRTKIHNN
jgi:hypothetical protein